MLLERLRERVSSLKRATAAVVPNRFGSYLHIWYYIGTVFEMQAFSDNRIDQLGLSSQEDGEFCVGQVAFLASFRDLFVEGPFQGKGK